VGHIRRGVDRITETLQQYADRGVFRGFNVTRHDGRREYRFTWLTRRPTTIEYDLAARALTFRGLFPAVRSRPQMVSALHALVANRASRELPSHKRLDRRRAILASSVRKGDWSLKATIRGANDEYATRLALNLVNELFLLLHENYPDYLIEEFGISGE
jgi:hypothetical protein